MKIISPRRPKPEEVYPEGARIKGPNTCPCPIFKEGQEIGVNTGDPPQMPPNFPPQAWDVNFRYLMELGAGEGFSEGYEKPGGALVACPDRYRPVTFLLEWV